MVTSLTNPRITLFYKFFFHVMNAVDFKVFHIIQIIDRKVILIMFTEYVYDT